MGPWNPADPHVGISPSCPTPTAPNFARVSLRCQHPAGPRKELELHCRGDLVLSCGIGTTGGEMELPQGFVSIFHFHIPTLQPGTFPLPGRGQGTVYCTPCICCITSSEQNKWILEFVALLPSGLALSLQVGSAHPSIKTPTTKPQSFQKASKAPHWLLCFPHRAPVKLFSRE